MSNYRMTLIVGGREINIPVLPAKLNVSSPGKNERVTVLDLGEVLLLLFCAVLSPIQLFND